MFHRLLWLESDVPEQILRWLEAVTVCNIEFRSVAVPTKMHHSVVVDIGQRQIRFARGSFLFTVDVTQNSASHRNFNICNVISTCAMLIKVLFAAVVFVPANDPYAMVAGIVRAKRLYPFVVAELQRFPHQTICHNIEHQFSSNSPPVDAIRNSSTQ